MSAPTIVELRDHLRNEFGLDGFRPGQVKACRSALDENDTIVVMPTGSGKSLCYQLPGSRLKGVTVVVGPLIALAEDQAMKLNELGYRTAVLNSSRSKKQIESFRDKLKDGACDFVFTTPERLQSSDICEVLAAATVGLLVIDEAHCVTQWGNDFRPDYLGLRHARKRMGNPPILAMTATASAATIEEISGCLKLREVEIIQTGVARRNLKLAVEHVKRSGKDDRLGDLLSQQNGPTLVYCSTTTSVDSLKEAFSEQRRPVFGYHGRMRMADRKTSQDEFIASDSAVMFATKAFGMGIDKPDIRAVIHYQIPGSIDSYYQEVGRAGRDGNQADCTLLFDRRDIAIRKRFAAKAIDSSTLMTAYADLVRETSEGSTNDHRVKLSELSGRSALSRVKLKQCFQLLASRGIAAPCGRGKWELVKADVKRDVIDRLAIESEFRAERRSIAVQRMVEFAESDKCRWQQIHEYFGQAWSEDECRCDRC